MEVATVAASDGVFVHDVRLATADAFAWLRNHVDGDGCALREATEHLSTREQCLEWLRVVVSKPARTVSMARPDEEAPSRGSGTDVSMASPLKVLTWNVNHVIRPKSAQAPSDDRA